MPGPKNNLNKNLEYAGRVADYLEFAELLTLDALHRTESCGGHFREESQTPDGEALRDDANFSYVAAWEFQDVGSPPVGARLTDVSSTAYLSSDPANLMRVRAEEGGPGQVYVVGQSCVGGVSTVPPDPASATQPTALAG